MKHATPATLDTIEPLLAGIRKFAGLRERSRGIFYRKSIAYLHFHEDPAGLFADVKLDGSWKRLEVTTAAAKRVLLASVRRDADTTLARVSPASRRPGSGATRRR